MQTQKKAQAQVDPHKEIYAKTIGGSRRRKTHACRIYLYIFKGIRLRRQEVLLVLNWSRPE